MGTELVVNDKVIATRNAAGGGKTVVNMNVTKPQWQEYKTQRANTDRMEYDVATAEAIVKDWVRKGATIRWKTAKDWNQSARELENHRFRKDPNVPSFEKSVDNAKQNAHSSMRDIMNVVK